MNKFMKRLAKDEGFTLVELIVVIAILAILAGVATAGYSGYIQNANDAAVLSDMDAILTAATAANAVNGEIDEIVINKEGTKATITADTSLSLKFVEDFKLYYGNGTGTVADADKDGVADSLTVEITINAINGWDNSKYGNGKDGANGAKWNGSEWEVVK